MGPISIIKNSKIFLMTNKNGYKWAVKLDRQFTNTCN